MKIFWLDTETGGLTARKNPILTIAGQIEIGGKLVDEFYFKVKPLKGQIIEDSALNINGITRKEIETFEEPESIHKQLNELLGRYCDKFDKSDKYIIAGHNVGFDVDMLKAFYMGLGDNYLFSWLDYHKLDTMGLALMLKTFGFIKPVNVKLETLASYYGVELKAHNAQNDIRATREIFYKMKERIRYVEIS